MIRQMEALKGLLNAKTSSVVQKVPEKEECAGVVSLHACPALVLFLHISATGCCRRKSGSVWSLIWNRRSYAVNIIWNSHFGTVEIYFWNLLRCVNTLDALWIHLNSKVVLPVFLIAFLLLSCKTVIAIQTKYHCWKEGCAWKSAWYTSLIWCLSMSQIVIQMLRCWQRFKQANIKLQLLLQHTGYVFCLSHV